MTSAPLVGFVPSPDLHVMTYNIRRRMPGLDYDDPDLWSRRKPLLQRFLAGERPAVLGVQEALSHQRAAVSNGLGAAYRAIGRGRNRDGAGEGCPIFVDRARVRIDGWTQLALSSTPDVPGSVSWGNEIPRLAVVAEVVDLETGGELLVVNTHFDHVSHHSRIRSAELIADLVASAGTPALVMGDFNCRVDSEPYLILAGRGGLSDAWEVADSRLTRQWGTFPNYQEPLEGARRIDWVLVAGAARVASAAINPARFEGVWASDHCPVQAVVTFPGVPA